jgi:hypothetical protein
MASFSSLEALGTLCASIPDWNTRLDELNGQIALRQIELARLEDHERPPTRSLKNKGSTESLRPKDGSENPFSSNESENPDDIQLNPFDSPKSQSNGFITAQRPTSSAAARAGAMSTPPPPKASSNPRPTPNVLSRQFSQPTPPTQARIGLRKRKTDSIASGESLAPKYRTRSMIIVYYDSAVQTAFEDLVKFVSGSRNAMRKGKMAAKMAEMRRVAELEVGPDDEVDETDENPSDMATNTQNLLAAQKNMSINKEGQSQMIPAIGVAADDDASELEIPKLRFVSTRQMGPTRDYSFGKPERLGVTTSVGLLGGYRRSGSGTPDIFDDLDKGLEWCQGQCEHAAHQFLRDGECTTEIENIKRKLVEVKAKVEQEIEKLKSEAAANPSAQGPQPVENMKRSLQMKTPQMRRDAPPARDLEVDIDEGVDDLEPPPKLVFKRSRDIAP